MNASPYLLPEHEALRDTIRRFVADRVLPRPTRGSAPAASRARSCARWAPSACSASVTTLVTAAAASTRWRRPYWPRNWAVRPTAASRSRCWSTPTWPRRISSCRHGRAEGPLPAGDRRRRAHHRGGDDRGRCRLGPGRHADAGERDGDCWVLNGGKMFITNGVHADLYIVAAKTAVAPVTEPARSPDVDVPGRARDAGLLGRRPLEKRAGCRATRPNWCSTSAGFRPRNCSATRAAVSTRWSGICRTNGSCLERRRWAKRRGPSN